MIGWLRSGALALVLPVVLSVLAFYLTQVSKRAAKWIDQRSAPEKQALAFAWAAALTTLTATVGRSVCVDGSELCSLDAVDWKLVLTSTWGGALALHGWGRSPAKSKG